MQIERASENSTDYTCRSTQISIHLCVHSNHHHPPHCRRVRQESFSPSKYCTPKYIIISVRLSKTNVLGEI